ncbi:hypothetical protein O6H91_01G150200 [Diphasiastrum complanatum]|uniref:Uncharacterized protein n=1 Tax=Diphasiastrum complanatum TaxID=34168 RepID=A0ACC2EXE9_DIPCM|nr:hypothetical protein O6H91_Y505900 [Diphasiastrum complanatum]KAJ7571129.1 hypothetical protein O6H91_01G150200 [Diphasiastrum complanatum]
MGLCASVDVETNTVCSPESDADDLSQESSKNGSTCAGWKPFGRSSSNLHGSRKNLLNLMRSRSTHRSKPTAENLEQQLAALEEAYHALTEEEANSSGPLWRRTILMGEKCEPPDFSGLILYNANGERITEYPAKL